MSYPRMACGGNITVRVTLAGASRESDLMLFPASRAAGGLLLGHAELARVEQILKLSGMFDHWVSDPLDGPFGVVVFQLRRPPVDSEGT